MTVDLRTLDAHEQPTDELRSTWKAYSKTDHAEFIHHPEVDDLSLPEKAREFRLAGSIPAEKVVGACRRIEEGEWKDAVEQEIEDVPIYLHPLLPGLLILPSLIPPSTQKALLSRMVHRDLSNPIHNTNLHLHYELPYHLLKGGDESTTSASFFSLPTDSPPNFTPKDPTVHRPLSIKQVLDRKLSWVTLGGQYDWTNRVYPPEENEQQRPSFPPDIADFLQSLFPETQPQAAIVNFYRPGDTMMMHRDVSEATDKGLVSLSLGCDALFMIAPSGDESSNTDEKSSKRQHLLLRLRSGDAIYMTNESRYAWHGVPKVLKGTCPEFLADWPAGEDGDDEGKYEDWRGWMRNKRVNLNVRQMRD